MSDRPSGFDEGDPGPPQGGEGPARRGSWGSLGAKQSTGRERTKPAPGATRLEVVPAFRCEPYTSRLTVDACAGRHREPTLQRRTCRTCPVGKAHAAGKQPTSWPDGAPIQRGTLEVRVLVAGPPKGKRTPYA